MALGAPGGWREAPVALGAPGGWREAPVVLVAPGGWREAPVALGAPGVWHEASVVLSAALGAPGLALGAPGSWREALVALPVLSGERDALVALDGELAAPYDDFIDSEDAAPCRVYIVVPFFEDWSYYTYHDVMLTRARAPAAAILPDKLMSGSLPPAFTRQRRWSRVMASKEFKTCTQFARRTRVVAVRAPHPRDGEPSGPSAASASGGRAGERRRH